MGRRLWWQQEAVESKREQQHPEVISWWEKQVSGMKRGRLAPEEKVNMAIPRGERGREIEELLDPSHPSQVLLS